jgi:hypothetical protein
MVKAEKQVDSSSGAIGTAVNRAIDQLVPVIAAGGIREGRKPDSEVVRTGGAGGGFATQILGRRLGLR